MRGINSWVGRLEISPRQDRYAECTRVNVVTAGNGVPDWQ